MPSGALYKAFTAFFRYANDEPERDGCKGLLWPLQTGGFCDVLQSEIENYIFCFGL